MLVPKDSDINPELLSRSNKTWNQLRLNHPWSVGFTSELIRNYNFSNYHDWRIHYLESGVIRDKRLMELTQEERNTLNDHDWYHNATIEKRQTIGNVLMNLNFHRGRSPMSIVQKSKIFAPVLRQSGLDISDETCATFIGHRILIESWNGHVRETNTISQLEKQYGDFIFLPSDGWDDYKYAIDFTIERDDNLIGAIQIKPESYIAQTDYIDAAKKSNVAKNEKYKEVKGVPVWTVISTLQGKIISDDNLLSSLDLLL